MGYVLLLGALLGAAQAELPGEAPIIPNAVPLEEPGRYRSPRNYEDTLDFYRRIFNSPGTVRWRSIINLPSIKAKHVESLRSKTHWAGLNIYEKDGETRIYVVIRADKNAESSEEPPVSGKRSAQLKK